jgi:hypothetical protein
MNLTAELIELRRRSMERPLPRVAVDGGRFVPGWCFHVLAPLAVGGLVVSAGLYVGLMSTLVLVVGAAFALWVAIRPGPAPAHLAVLLTALVLLGAPGAPFDPVVLGLAPLALLGVRLTWWAGHVARATRVETASLVRAGRRDVVVLAVALGTGGVGWLAAGFAVGGLVILGAAALVALVVALLRTSRP